MTLIEEIIKRYKIAKAVIKEDYCAVCGYYCLGNGGFGCIDKPTLIKLDK